LLAWKITDVIKSLCYSIILNNKSYLHIRYFGPLQSNVTEIAITFSETYILTNTLVKAFVFKYSSH